MAEVGGFLALVGAGGNIARLTCSQLHVTPLFTPASLTTRRTPQNCQHALSSQRFYYLTGPSHWAGTLQRNTFSESGARNSQASYRALAQARPRCLGEDATAMTGERRAEYVSLILTGRRDVPPLQRVNRSNRAPAPGVAPVIGSKSTASSG